MENGLSLASNEDELKHHDPLAFHWGKAQIAFNVLMDKMGHSNKVVNFMDTIVDAQDLNEYQVRLAKKVGVHPSENVLLLFSIVNNLLACSQHSEVVRGLLPFAESHDGYTNRDIFPLKFLRVLFATDAAIASLGISTGQQSSFPILQEHIAYKEEQYHRKYTPRSLSA